MIRHVNFIPKSGRLFLVLALSLCLFACATNPPKKEREDAELAFRAAKEAEKCAALRYAAAEKALTTAQRLINEKKYDDARQHFLVAKELSDKALAEAKANTDCMNPKPAEAPKPVEATTTGETASSTFKDGSLDDPNYKLETIYFPFNSSDITDQAKDIIAKNAAWMNKHSATKIIIAGHCDKRGSTEYNLALGQRRAQSVKDYMIKIHSVNPDFIDVISYGEEQPLRDGDLEEAFTLNRRAEFSKQ